MVSIFTGMGAGYARGSGAILGGGGLLGSGSFGRGGESVSVNGANGNLLISNQDEFLVGRGLDVGISRTYNSAAELSDRDNGDNWQQSTTKRVYGLTGTLNTVGSTVSRQYGDGSAVVYTWNDIRKAYVTTDGDGAHDMLVKSGSTWVWTDGSSQVTEVYEATVASPTTEFRIKEQKDTDGNKLSFTYVDLTDKIYRIMTANNGTVNGSTGIAEQSYVEYKWSGNNITEIVTGYTDYGTDLAGLADNVNKTLTRTRYAYDGQNRLITVTVDLSPGDNDDSDGATLVTSYTYDSTTSKRVASISTTGGAILSITYDGSNRVSKLEQTVGGVTRTTALTYGANYTTVTGPDGQVTRLDYDSAKQLTKITSPTSEYVQFTYDANGNLTKVRDTAGKDTLYGYSEAFTQPVAGYTTANSSLGDSNYNPVRDNAPPTLPGATPAQPESGTGDAFGNLTKITDPNGTVTERWYDVKNSLVRETQTYLDEVEATVTLTTRYAYDSENHLRYVVSPEGRVREYRYTSYGEVQYVVAYPEHDYAVGTTIVSEADLNSWKAGIVDLSSIEIVWNVYDGRSNLIHSNSHGIAMPAGTTSQAEGFNRTYYSYDQAGRLGFRWLYNELSEEFRYDGLGRLKYSVDLAGGPTTITFNDASLTTQITTGTGYTSVQTYNAWGDLVSEEHSGSEEVPGKTDYRYDALGRVRMITTPLGVETPGDATDYNSFILYDNAGRKTADIAADGSVVEYRYDTAGRLAATIARATKLTPTQMENLATAGGNVLLGAASIGTGWPVTATDDVWNWSIYDFGGRLIQSIDNVGEVVDYFYDNADRLIKTVAYATRIIGTTVDTFKTTLPTTRRTVGTSTEDRITRSFYDGDGLLIAVLDGEGYLSGAKYDEAGRKVEDIAYAVRTDPAQRSNGKLVDLLSSAVTSSTANRRTHYVYDGQGLLRYQVDNLGYVTGYDYSLTGRSRHTTTIAYAAHIATSDYTFDKIDELITPLAVDANDRESYNVYNTRGQVVYTIDPSGMVTGFTYDVGGRVIKTVQFATLRSTPSLPSAAVMDTWAGGQSANSGNKVNRTYYSAGGKILFTVDAAGFRTENVFDADGNLVSTTLSANPVTVTDGTSIGALRAMSAGASITSIFAHDPTGRVLRVKDPEMGVTTYEYNALGQVVKITDPLSKNSYQYYDGVGRLVAVRDAEDQVTRTTYNAFGEVTSVIRLFNNTSDPVSTTIAPDVTLDAAKDMAAYSYYDDLGRLTFTVDAEKGVTRFYYDGFGAVVQQVRYATTYNAVATTKIAQLETTFGLESAAVPTTAALATSSYDGLGRVITQTDASNVATTLSYNAMSELASVTREGAITSFLYNKRGQVTKSTDAEGWFESYGYDAFGNRTSVTAKSKDGTKVAGGTTTYTYDRRGLLLSETLPIASYKADGTVQAASITNTYAYDAQGNRTQMVEAAGLTEARTTTYQYDKLGRLTQSSGQARTVLDQSNHTAFTTGFVPTETIVYDAAGNVTSVTDAAGQRTVYFYDDIGRKIVEIRGGGTAINVDGTYTRYAYDTQGDVTSTRVYEAVVPVIPDNGGSDTATAANAPGTIFRETLFTYDRLGRLTKSSVTSANITGPNAADYALKTGFYNGTSWTSALTAIDLTYQYDVFGNVVKTTDANTNAAWSYYDKLGRKTHEVDALNYLTVWTYDGDGNVLTEKRYSVAVATPTSTTTLPDTPGADSAMRETVFTYDTNGNRLSETRKSVTIFKDGIPPTTEEVDATIRWEYNGLGQVVRKLEATDDASITTDDNSHSTRYTYDVGGRLIQERRAEFVSHQSTTVTPTVDYRYNALGDLARTVAVGAGDAADRISTYTYGAGGLLATMTDAEGGVHTYSYNKNGTQIRDEYSRSNSAGTATLNAVLTKVDALGRTIEQAVASWTGSAWAKGDIATTGYNVYGEVGRTGLNGIWQQENVYDVAGRLWATNSGDGVWKIFGYDKNGNQTIAIANAGYSLTGKKFDEALAQIGLETVNATYTVYDKRNMATSAVEEQRRLKAGTDPDAVLKITTSRTYNAFGETLTETNARTGVTTYSYNRMGRVVRSEGPAAQITLENGKEIWVKPSQDFYYDRAGRLVAQRDANGTYAETGTNSGTATSKTAYTGNLTRLTLLAGTGYSGSQALVTTETQADNGVKTVKYDVHGDARLSIDAAMRETEQVFDKLGRLVQVTHPGATGDRLIDSYSYDILGQRLKHWNNFLTTAPSVPDLETTDYDVQGRVIATRSFGGDVSSTTYTWDATIAAITGTVTGGWTETIRMSDSAANLAASIYKQSSDKSDIFGRVVEKTDMGSHITTYAYDVAGRQTSATLGSTVTSFTYFNTGQLATNTGLAGVATYRYDLLGNCTYEKLDLGGVMIKEQAANYDAAGRLTLWSATGTTTTPAAHTYYYYDANSNIRRQKGEVYGLSDTGAPVSPVSTDYWFAFDSMNRLVIDQGSLLGTAGAAGTVIIRGSGTSIEYNEAGDRAYSEHGNVQVSRANVWRRTAWGVHTYHTEREYDDGATWVRVTISAVGSRLENYVYDAAGRLSGITQQESTVIFTEGTSAVYASTLGSSKAASVFGYDLMGRQTSQDDYDAAGTAIVFGRDQHYNAKGQLIEDDSATLKSDGATYRSITRFDYGAGATYALGSILFSQTDSYKNGVDGDFTDTATRYSYAWYDGAVQTLIEHDKSYANDYVSGTPGMTQGGSYLLSFGVEYTSTFNNNALGQLNSVLIADGMTRTVTFTNDEAGQIIRRDETRPSNAPSGQTGSPHEVYYRYAGKQMAFTGNNGSTNTDYRTSIADRTATAGAGTFRNGAMGGPIAIDTTLSYDAINSYGQGSAGGSYQVQSGDTLTGIAQAVYGDASLWYKIAEANGLGANAALIEGQSLVLPAGVSRNTHNLSTLKPYDPAEAMGDLSPTTPKPPKKPKCMLLRQIVSAVVAVVAQRFLGPIWGNLVSQGFNNLIGLQSGFSWKSLGMSVVSYGVTQGLDGAFNGIQSSFVQGALQGAASSALTQGIGVATGLQKKFDFAGVAAAGVGGGVANWAGVRGSGSLVANTVGGLANAATRSALNGNSFGDNLIAAIPDIIASTVHSSLRGYSILGDRKPAQSGGAGSAEQAKQVSDATAGADNGSQADMGVFDADGFNNGLISRSLSGFGSSSASNFLIGPEGRAAAAAYVGAVVTTSDGVSLSQIAAQAGGVTSLPAEEIYVAARGNYDGSVGIAPGAFASDLPLYAVRNWDVETRRDYMQSVLADPNVGLAGQSAEAQAWIGEREAALAVAEVLGLRTGAAANPFELRQLIGYYRQGASIPGGEAYYGAQLEVALVAQDRMKEAASAIDRDIVLILGGSAGNYILDKAALGAA